MTLPVYECTRVPRQANAHCFLCGHHRFGNNCSGSLDASYTVGTSVVVTLLTSPDLSVQPAAFERPELQVETNVFLISSESQYLINVPSNWPTWFRPDCGMGGTMIVPIVIFVIISLFKSITGQMPRPVAASTYVCYAQSSPTLHL